MICPLGIVWRSPAGPTSNHQQYRRPLRFSQDDIWSLKVRLLPWSPFVQLPHPTLSRLRFPNPLRRPYPKPPRLTFWNTQTYPAGHGAARVVVITALAGAPAALAEVHPGGTTAGASRSAPGVDQIG
jgi:hypothetical protein